MLEVGLHLWIGFVVVAAVVHMHHWCGDCCCRVRVRGYHCHRNNCYDCDCCCRGSYCTHVCAVGIEAEVRLLPHRPVVAVLLVLSVVGWGVE